MFPAGAGMNRPILGIRGNSCRVPRRRGDEPLSTFVSGSAVFPAGAGMNRRMHGPLAGSECSPQARG